ncbi:MAG TPA: ferrochelatase [Hyphomicrobiaceae bacterium]|nr:ferrochelatase [Hyphomicrobiaceae bacterium]
MNEVPKANTIGMDQAERSVLPADHPPVRHGRIGVLLLNLGTPDATDYWSMRRYLKEFLSDRRVIETPRIIWWPVLNLIILTKRPRAKGRDYDTIWNKEKDEGPLKTITRDQAEKLAAALDNPRIVVDWAMRYANPTTESRIKALMEQGCDRILLVPLYPQYAAATTATACDQAFRALMKMRWQPYVRVAPDWHDDPVYIEALARSMEAHLAQIDFRPEAVIATFHGMPEKYLHQGDPYYCQCEKTSRLLRERLGWPKESWHTTYQSRFGNDVWLQPYTDETVKRLAQSGVKKLLLIAPGFTADCLETLEELEVENREIFMENGGEKFTYVPALNASPEGMRVIEHVVRRELMGWV